MKTKITVAMAVFIGFALCFAAVAYYPVMIVRECPHCRAHIVQEDTLSGNTFGAKHYTDGKREAKMLPDHPWLVKCPFCRNLFWLDEAVEVDTGFDAAKGNQKVLAPSEKEMLAYLAGNTLPKDKEVYLRLHAWWAANDVWRWVPNATPVFSGVQTQNLDALASLLDESEPGQRILKAEIAREHGDFDQCLRLLAYNFDEGYERAVGFIRRLASERVRNVKQFPPPK
jgi:hypothetical protein